MCVLKNNMDVSTFVIAPKDEADEHRTRVEELGLPTPTIVDPVFTEDRCVNNTRGETGCFRAHKNVWSMCAEQEKPHCVILEKDWSIGDQSIDDVKEKLKKDDFAHYDYYQLGYCGPWCTHAYVLTKEKAEELSKVDECKAKTPVDNMIVTMCKTNKMSCGKYEHANMKGYYGNGIIQQIRDGTGMHSINNGFNSNFK